MGTIKDYIQERITLNHLPLNINECLAVIETYETIYSNVSEKERFFLFIKNKVGEILTNIDEDLSEILGWLHVHKSKQDIVYFLFETEEDYYNWLSVRKDLYLQLNEDYTRLLNFLELSTMDFISDITTNCNYILELKNKKTDFKKEGYGVDVESTISFIKYLGASFKKGYNFKPTKI
jgi:hypothetical protein